MDINHRKSPASERTRSNKKEPKKQVKRRQFVIKMSSLSSVWGWQNERGHVKTVEMRDNRQCFPANDTDKKVTIAGSEWKVRTFRGVAAP